MSVVDFADIVLAALERRASDIHLTAGAAPSIRVRGRLFPLEGFPVLGVSDTREIVYSIMSDTQRQQFENARQVDFSYSVPRTARMRVNAYLQRGAVSAALRVIPSVIQSLETLGMPPAVREMADLPRGMVLVTGPTGSGKSTTLAAVIDEINTTREEHILTIEDPIEFLHQPQAVPGQPARAGQRRDELLRRPARRAARGPRRDPRGRDARPGDDLHRADRGRDRPPGAGDPAHPGRPADDRPHHRRLPAPPAAARARDALRGPPGRRRPAAAADRRRLRPGSRRRDPHPHPGGAQPHPRGQDPPDLLRDPDGCRVRHADDGRRSGGPRPRGPHLPRRRAAPRLGPEPSSPGCWAVGPSSRPPARTGICNEQHQLRLPRRRRPRRQAQGRGRGRIGGRRDRSAQGPGPDRPRGQGQDQVDGTLLRPVHPGESRGPGADDTATLDDDLVGLVTDARAGGPRSADTEQAAVRHRRGHPSGHRERRFPVGSPGQAPQGLLRAVRRDDPRRGDRRVPGERAHPRRRPARGAAQASASGQVGHGLSGRGVDHRDLCLRGDAALHHSRCSPVCSSSSTGRCRR